MKVKHLLLVLVILTAAFGLYKLWGQRDDGLLSGLRLADKNIIAKKIARGLPKDPFKSPVGVFVDANDRIFVADSDNHRIRIFSQGWKLVDQFGKYGPGREELGYPVAVAVNSSGEVFVSEINNNRVQVLSDQGRFIRWFPYNKADLKGPSAMIIDQADRVYIFDRGDHKVKLFNKDGHLITTFGGTGNPGETLRYVMGMSLLPDGSLVLTDSGSKSVKIFDQNGRLKEELRRNVNGVPYIGLPRGLAIINEHKFAVVDSLSRKVYLISRSGQGWQNEALGHNFVLPDGAFYRAGKLYITDRGDDSILVFDNIK